MMRIALAILMGFHGLAHLAGFAGAWQIAPEGFPYKTTILRGHVDLGKAGIRVVGTLWLITGVAFAVAAIGTLFGVAWWPQFALVIAIVSLLLSIAELPEARLGVVINVVIIAALIVGRRLGWI
jgi:hypothetical protein